MVGSNSSPAAGRTSDIKDDVRLNVENLTVMSVEGRPAVDGVPITIRSGEIVGIAGVEGNGQYELCAAPRSYAVNRHRPVDGADLTSNHPAAT